MQARDLNKLKCLLLEILIGKADLSIRKIEGYVYISDNFDEYVWQERYDHFDILDALKLLEREGSVIVENYHWRLK